MAPPYRRSCDPCAKGKRKCDQAAPSCERCTSRGLQCRYSGAVSAISSEQMNSVSPSNQNSLLQANNANGQVNTQIADNGFELSNDVHSNSSFPYLEVPLLDNGTSDWSNLMIEIDQVSGPDQLPLNGGEWRVVTRGGVNQARVGFATKLIQSWPSLFAKNGHAPFVNLSLWTEDEVPGCLLDAISTCALYNVKESIKATFVLENLRRKAQALCKDIDPTFCVLSPMDFLAAVQALIMYQIIQLFDGDIRQRAEAESHDDVLSSWTDHLKSLMVPLSASAGGIINSSPQDSQATPGPSGSCFAWRAWQAWLYQESVRRTVLVSLLLRGIYTFLKCGEDSIHNETQECEYTAQKALWQASSQYDWQSARQEFCPYEIQIKNFEVVEKEAHPEDLDDLGTTLWALINGMDDIKRWLGDERLEHYGLDP